MPEGYTHVRTARRAARAARYQVHCPAAFAIGANGPDALFCFEVWKPARKRRYDLPALGNRMHEENTGAFLKSLVTHVRTQAQIDYTLGFLSHYAADTVLHPYVVALCQPGMPYAGPGGHGYFEIALDTTLHAEDTGVSVVPAEDTSPLLPGPDLAEVTALLHTALQETYGLDIPVEHLADAFYHLNRVRRLFPSRHGVNQALMELGALVCLPNGAPLCGQCPLAALCRGRAAGRAEQLPVKPAKKPRPELEFTVAVVRGPQGVLLQKRPERGLLAGLWQPLLLEGALAPPQLADALAALGLPACSLQPLGAAKHVFTHKVWRMQGYLARTDACALPDRCVWATAEQLETAYSVPSAFAAFAPAMSAPAQEGQ